MKNSDVIRKFLNKQIAHTTNLYTKTEENKFVLVNYQTAIAYIEGNTLWINQCKYSATTSTIQGQLEYQARMTNYNIVYYNEGKINRKGGARYEKC